MNQRMWASAVSIAVLALAVVLGLGLLSCGNSGTSTTQLAVHTVDWDSHNAVTGKVAAVGETDAMLGVFSDIGAQVLVGGTVIATDKTVTSWAWAGTMPAPDDQSETWIVGLDGMGQLYRLRADVAEDP